MVAMKQDRQGPAALTVLAVGLSLVAADLLIARANSPGAIQLILLGTLPYWVIGAFLLWRQPRVRIGWILLAFACSWTLTFLGVDYARFAIDQGLPGAIFSAWVGEWTWLVALLIIFVVIPVLFPDGQPLTKRWDWVLKAVVVFLFVFIAATTFQQSFDIGIRLDNPLALLPYEDAETALLPMALVFLVLGAVSTVTRYRSRRGLERQQLLWFVFSVFLTIVMFVANAVFEPDGMVGDVLAVAGLSAPALAIGIAVMRYRLFDIDKIITRTITYGLVTSLLIGVYAGTVFLISSLVPTAGSLAVAGATLLAAALFAPMRRRAQALVDRRFNRSTYDARITMEQLSNRLRSEVDVYALGSEVGRVVTTTMQPEKLAVWIR